MNRQNTPRLNDSDVLLAGLAFTSRTETLEDYLKDKAGTLTVISISSCFLKENLSSCRVYEQGRKVKDFKIPNFRIKDYTWWRQPLVVLVFMVNWFSVCYCLLRLRKKFDFYFGVSHSFALWGALLKKLGIVKTLIYYCIDYYHPGDKLTFNYLFVNFLNWLDRFTVRNSDCIWDLSRRIPVEREKRGGIRFGSYKNTVVPLGYSSHLRRCKPFPGIRRWDIGFVGSVSANQGLQLLVEAMPEITRVLPQVTVTVIGQGPYLGDLKKMVNSSNLGKHFNFLGFIKDENEMLDILCASAISVALYAKDDFGNQACADTGKPKLYCLLGLPVITTDSYMLHEEISGKSAGIVIEYDVNELAQSVKYLLEDDGRLEGFRQRSYKLGENFISDRIFDAALESCGLHK